MFHQYLRTIPPFCTWDKKVHVAKIFTFYQSGDTYGISWNSVKKSHLWLHSGAPHHCSSFSSSSSVCPPISIFNSSSFIWYWTGFAHGAATISSDESKRLYEKGKSDYKDRNTLHKGNVHPIVDSRENMSDHHEFSPDVKMLHGQLFSHIFTLKKETYFNILTFIFSFSRLREKNGHYTAHRAVVRSVSSY